tara:strand:+ start:1747 stop:2193 length:447 start_codon:yes stop_codon:yes gene_type:complete
MIIAAALHVIAALIWVGGFFFILVILRPASIRIEPPQRFRLFAKVFQWFFPWVWGLIAVLLITGYWMLLSGQALSGLHTDIMQGLGIAMMLLFGHLYHAPYKRFSEAVDEENWAKTNYQANRMRRAIRWNLLLGLATAVVATTGRYWS